MVRGGLEGFPRIGRVAAIRRKRVRWHRRRSRRSRLRPAWWRRRSLASVGCGFAPCRSPPPAWTLATAGPIAGGRHRAREPSPASVSRRLRSLRPRWRRRREGDEHRRIGGKCVGAHGVSRTAGAALGQASASSAASIGTPGAASKSSGAAATRGVALRCISSPNSASPALSSASHAGVPACAPVSSGIAASLTAWRRVRAYRPVEAQRASPSDDARRSRHSARIGLQRTVAQFLHGPGRRWSCSANFGVELGAKTCWRTTRPPRSRRTPSTAAGRRMR